MRETFVDDNIVLRDENPVRRLALKDHPPRDLKRRVELLKIDPRMDQYLSIVVHDLFLCYRLCLDYAAIVTGCTLVELAIKTAVLFRVAVAKGMQAAHKDWEHHDRRSTEGAIKDAEEQLGIELPDFWKEVRSFRTEYRGVYLHGRAPQPVLDTRVDVVSSVVGSGVVTESSVRLADDMSMQRRYRPVYDRDIVDYVVDFSVRVANVMTSNMASRYADWQKQMADAGRLPSWDQVLADVGRLASMYPDASFVVGPPRP